MASVKVAVRVRPMNEREKESGSSCIVTCSGSSVIVANPCSRPDLLSTTSTLPPHQRQFTFDYSYPPETGDDDNQEKVFNDIGKPLVDDALEGYNCSIFAYGQTGSGKTYTMMGSAEREGLVPRIAKELFRRMKILEESGMKANISAHNSITTNGYKLDNLTSSSSYPSRLNNLDEIKVTRQNLIGSFRVEVSYLEIYNERVRDLLAGNGNLRVREHPTRGPYVQGLSSILVGDVEGLLDALDKGNRKRIIASTGMNESSSRSHAILTITFSQAIFGKCPKETISKINLVDLAGSERVNATGSTGDRLKEGCHINRSLVTVGNVIKALASSEKFIPYRDSVLTWLLKDSLGGNSKTVMITTLSPVASCYNETVCALLYANRAKSIVNKPKINEDENTKLIRELREEIDRLRKLLRNDRKASESINFESLDDQGVIKSTNDSYDKKSLGSGIAAKVCENEAKVFMLTEEWREKWRETQRILRESTLGLKNYRGGVLLDCSRPHLVRVGKSGISLVTLKDGENLLGGENCDVLLEDKSLCNCAKIEVSDKEVMLKILKNETIFLVDGIKVNDKIRLSNGCMIKIGNDVFRFNDPTEIQDTIHDNNTKLAYDTQPLNNSNSLKALSEINDSCLGSWDNLWCQVNDGEVLDRGVELRDLEEKKNEIEELIEEHKRAEKRREEELEKAGKELELKRKQLILGIIPDENLIRYSSSLEKSVISNGILEEIPLEQETIEVTNSIDEDLSDISLSSLPTSLKSLDAYDNNNVNLEEINRLKNRLKQMEESLSIQRELFELQRNKEMNQIEREKSLLLQMEMEAKLDIFIEKEVQRRLKEAQIKYESSWREQLESRASDYLRITSVGQDGDSENIQDDDCDFCVEIPSFEWVETKWDSHWEYDVRIGMKGERMHLKRRYREFRLLFKEMGELNHNFPPRKWWAKGDVRVAKERRKSLEIFLNKFIKGLVLKGINDLDNLKRINWFFNEGEKWRRF